MVGGIGAVSCARLLLHGWVTSFWTAPAHHFHYPGLSFVRPLPAPWLHLLVALVGVAYVAGAVSAVTGRCSRRWLLAATAGFAYLEALDVTTYLNHYWLLTLAGLLVAALPEGGPVPRWAVGAVRTLVATTYLWAAVAKLDGDWLAGRPLHHWLAVHDTWPLVGPRLDERSVAVVAAWAGLAFDTLAIPALLWRRTRPAALVAVVAFHGATALLFPIGVFPWLMVGLSLVFLPPDWPACLRARLSRRLPRPATSVLADGDRPPGRGGQAPGRHECHAAAACGGLPAWVVFSGLAVLALVPARAYLSDVKWSEHGGQFTWRVMAVDMVGLIELAVRAADGSVTMVRPERDLTPFQVRQMSWQPDLIRQWAHLVAAGERRRTGGPVEVRADSWISVNGRAPARFVDPTVDLTRVRWKPGRPGWILPPPGEQGRSRP